MAEHDDLSLILRLVQQRVGHVLFCSVGAITLDGTVIFLENSSMKHLKMKTELSYCSEPDYSYK